MQSQPFFLSNTDWYTEEKDDNGNISYRLTSEAPLEAIESFNDYYREPEFYDEDGNKMDFSGYVAS